MELPGRGERGLSLERLWGSVTGSRVPDWAGFGKAVPALHLAARLQTRPVRSRPVDSL